ncbi:hypothetical protein Q8A67_005607 [Cirrhinus molitorella]|uniref:AIG1-type G domain-containing protein n=1 Tax=Cirrhinus molitorella TaxID=172907 RepID=A0AA88TRV5_9TELE|nr:hypothetical protein Q8A67_005607 [Cirrhinus molitorella]
MIDFHEAEHVDHLIGQLVNENEIHAFIFVLRLGQLTDADKMGLAWLQTVFGEKVLQFVMILFTYERKEECDTIIDDLKKNSVLEQLLEKCGQRYHTCNKMINNQSEMRDLMDKIQSLFNENQQQCYTGEMYNTAQMRNSECGNNSLITRLTLGLLKYEASPSEPHWHWQVRNPWYKKGSFQVKDPRSRGFYASFASSQGSGLSYVWLTLTWWKTLW